MKGLELSLGNEEGKVRLVVGSFSWFITDEPL
jgi:hypothetical protein